MSVKSVVIVESVESMWMLKSPSRRTEVEREQSWVRNSEKSERNDGFGLGGR